MMSRRGRCWLITIIKIIRRCFIFIWNIILYPRDKLLYAIWNDAEVGLFGKFQGPIFLRNYLFDPKYSRFCIFMYRTSERLEKGSFMTLPDDGNCTHRWFHCGERRSSGKSVSSFLYFYILLLFLNDTHEWTKIRDAITGSYRNPRSLNLPDTRTASTIDQFSSWADGNCPCCKILFQLITTRKFLSRRKFRRAYGMILTFFFRCHYETTLFPSYDFFPHPIDIAF